MEKLFKEMIMKKSVQELKNKLMTLYNKMHELENRREELLEELHSYQDDDGLPITGTNSWELTNNAIKDIDVKIKEFKKVLDVNETIYQAIVEKEKQYLNEYEGNLDEIDLNGMKPISYYYNISKVDDDFGIPEYENCFDVMVKFDNNISYNIGTYFDDNHTLYGDSKINIHYNLNQEQLSELDALRMQIDDTLPNSPITKVISKMKEQNEERKTM